MFRKLALIIVALTATAAITPASARGHGGGRGFHGGGHHGHFGGHRGHFGGRHHFGHRHHHHHHHRFARYGYYGGGYTAYAVGDSCYRVVDTEVGPRRVNVCD